MGDLQEVVSESVETVRSNSTFLSEEFSRRLALQVKNELYEELSTRLEEIDDEYVSHLEGRVTELETELDNATSKGYSALKNNLKHHKNLIKKLILYFEDGGNLQFSKPEISEMSDVDLGLVEKGDDIRITVHEPEYN